MPTPAVMTDSTNIQSQKLPPPRFPLITPSASPPVSRSGSRSSGSKPPPQTRPRLSLTPSSSVSSISRSTPSLSTPVSVEQSLHDARRASALRLMKAWSQIATRNRALDQDDIINLRDLKIVKDKGVLRGLDKTFEIGYFANDGNEEDASSEGGGAQTEGEDVDDEVDEFNAFRSGDGFSGGLGLEQKIRHIPPVQRMDPADEEDLREFMEAEQMRRELCGEEEDEVEEALDTGRVQTARSSEVSDFEGYTSFEEELVDENMTSQRAKSVRSSSIESKFRIVQTGRVLTPTQDDSEDEFNTWDIDQTPARLAPQTPRRPKPKPKSTRATPSRRTPARTPRAASRPPPSVEIIDLTSPSPPSSPIAKRGRSRSRSRSKPPASKGRSKSVQRAKSKTPARRIRAISPVRVPSPPRQLQTPPLSSESQDSGIVERTYQDDFPSLPSPPRSSLEPFPAVTPKPKPKPVQPLETESEAASLREEEAAPSSDPVNKPHKIQKPNATPSSSKPRYVVEVVIPPRPKTPIQSNPPRTATPAPRKEDEVVPESPAIKPRASRKGKEKALDSETPILSSQDIPRTPPKKPSSKAAMRTKTRSPSSSPIPVPHVRKRKRILSSSSESGGEALPPTSSPVRSSPVKVHSSPIKKSASKAKQKAPLISILKSSSRNVFESDDELDEEPRHTRGSKRHKTSRTSARSSPVPFPPPQMYPYGLPYTPRHSRQEHPQAQQPSYPAFPVLPPQDPQAQYQFAAQVAQQISYLFSNGAAGFPIMPYPPPHHGHPDAQPFWPPFTPHHKRRDSRDSDSSPSRPDPSSSTMPATPAHRDRYFPSMYDPGYSSGTLPPSSPPISSPIISSPVLRARSRSRSKSVGRRVSFKLDGDERPRFLEPAENIPTRAISPEIPLASSQTEEEEGYGQHKRGRTPGPPSPPPISKKQPAKRR
ncbi:hypothetical protein C8Q75DRAFT_776674 [Abortiporus biennis]|nr:hypothetical protein C8Q75DRAFT_776674 [Abortiporus biennis]